MSICLRVSSSEEYVIENPTLTTLVDFCLEKWPTVLPCQFYFFVNGQPVSEISPGTVIDVEIRELLHIEWVPPEQLLQTRLLCSKRSWINYSREYNRFEVYSLHPKIQTIRRAIYYTDIKHLPSFYCTPTYIERKKNLTHLLSS